MTPLTVACIWVQGHVPYSSEYVTRLESMTRRFIQREFRFVCLTDRPWLLAGRVECIPIIKPPRVYGWWAKLELFNPAHALRGRVLYLDLDTLVVGPLDVIIDFPPDLALAPHAGHFNGKDGKQVVKRFNSSVMVFTAGTCDTLFTAWRPSVADRLWGDQDWIGEQRSDAVAMPVEWFPRLSSAEGRPPYDRHARVVLCKKPKNLEAASRWPWFREAWN